MISDQFGGRKIASLTREELMVLLITPQKKLARANAVEVLAQIEALGFYLQMPPTSAELLLREGNEL